MSEEEIIKEIESLSPSEEACEGILHLYNKEKEKNKELKVLIEQNLKYSHNLEKDLFENCSNYVVSKEKIREKLKEEQDRLKKGFGKMYQENLGNSATRILKELLEEE